MIKITISHVRTSPEGSTTTTIDDEYLGTIDGLANRLAMCRAALEAELPLRAEPEPSTEPVARPGQHREPEPWTSSRFFAWAKRTRGALDHVQSFGKEHGFPLRMLIWSEKMCNLAFADWQAQERSVA